MRPLRNWLSVKRKAVESDSILVLPVSKPDQRDSAIGTVTAVGDGVERKGKVRPLDTKVGDEIIYSSRVDRYRVGNEIIDVIDEGSVIGWLR